MHTGCKTDASEGTESFVTIRLLVKQLLQKNERGVALNSPPPQPGAGQAFDFKFCRLSGIYRSGGRPEGVRACDSFLFYYDQYMHIFSAFCIYLQQLRQNWFRHLSVVSSQKCICNLQFISPCHPLLTFLDFSLFINVDHVEWSRMSFTF